MRVIILRRYNDQGVFLAFVAVSDGAHVDIPWQDISQRCARAGKHWSKVLAQLCNERTQS